MSFEQYIKVRQASRTYRTEGITCVEELRCEKPWSGQKNMNSFALLRVAMSRRRPDTKSLKFHSKIFVHCQVSNLSSVTI